MYKKNNGLIDHNLSIRTSKLDTTGLTDWPDLIMIDGGKGQLSVVMNTLHKINLDDVKANISTFKAVEIIWYIFTSYIYEI